MTYKKLLDFFNSVKGYYKDLDALAKRLQDDYAGDKPFEQTEEDRLSVCGILDKIDEIYSITKVTKFPVDNRLTVEELKALQAGDWVWIITQKNNGDYYQKCYDCQNIAFSAQSMYRLFCEKYSDYGTKWVAYKNKEQAETNSKCVELQCKDSNTISIVDCETCSENNNAEWNDNNCPLKENGMCKKG